MNLDTRMSRTGFWIVQIFSSDKVQNKIV